jgi:glycosyltransferase involved in cell wall biosynthesis
MEFNNPKVSVVIPTYNRPHLIGRAIKSVLDQTYQNFEIVVIDDSPNEETEKIIKSLNDKRIKYIRNEERKGLSAARNQGVKMSDLSAKYIAFLDDDDEWLPQFLEKTINELEKNKELVAVTSLGEERLHTGEVIGRGGRYPREFWRCPIGNGWVIKKEIFLKENIWYDEKTRYEDVDFGIRIIKTNTSHKVEIIPEILKISYPYPIAKGESHSTIFILGAPPGNIEYFYKKNLEIYKKAGKKAESWLHYTLGIDYCKLGQFKEGRQYFIKGLLIRPNLKYFFYYLLTFIYPKIFTDLKFIILKHKIFRKWLKLI